MCDNAALNGDEINASNNRGKEISVYKPLFMARNFENPDHKFNDKYTSGAF